MTHEAAPAASTAGGPIRFLWFGSYAKGPGYPRSETLIAGLRALGHSVNEVHAPLLSGAADRVGIASGGGALSLAWRQTKAATKLAGGWFDAPPHDAVVVGYGGLADVPLLRMLQGFDRLPIVWDAFIPMYDAVVRDRGLASETSFRAKTLLRVEKLSARGADLVLADTAAHRDLLAADLGADPATIAVVPVAQPDPGEPAPLPGGGVLRVLLVASHIPLHGVGTVIDAARSLRGEGVAFTMVGAGQGLDAAVRAAEGIPAFDVIPRFVPEDEIAALHRSHHVALGIFGTTAKAARVVPLKAALAMSHGRALVTRDSVAARDALDGAAVLVAPGDPAALAGALAALRDDRPRIEALAAAARARYVERFTPRAAAQRLVDAVRPILVKTP